MSRKVNLVDQIFGKLRVLERLPEPAPDRYANWRCVCECGRETTASTKQLKRGTIRDCGCERSKRTDASHGRIPEDLTGQSFGYLKVIARADNMYGRVSWECLCDCGGTKVVTARDLKSGHVKSCGCLKYNGDNKCKDLTNMKIGQLTVLEKTDKRDYKGSVIWRVRCDCGNEREYSSDALLHGGTVSCGCFRQKAISLRNGLHRVDGTCLERLLIDKPRSDNKLQVVGVKMTSGGKYVAMIGFKRKRYYLGTYSTLEEAKKARKKVRFCIVIFWRNII